MSEPLRTIASCPARSPSLYSEGGDSGVDVGWEKDAVSFQPCLGEMEGASPETMCQWQSGLIEDTFPAGTQLTLPERLDTARATTASPASINVLEEISDAKAVKKDEAPDEADTDITPGTVEVALDQLLSCIREDGQVLPGLSESYKVAPSFRQGLETAQESFKKDTLKDILFLDITEKTSEEDFRNFESQFKTVEKALEGVPTVLDDVKLSIESTGKQAPSRKKILVARGVMAGLTLLGAIVRAVAVVAIAPSLPMIIGVCSALLVAAYYADIEFRYYSIGNQSDQWKDVKSSLKILNRYLEEKRKMLTLSDIRNSLQGQVQRLDSQNERITAFEKVVTKVVTSGFEAQQQFNGMVAARLGISLGSDLGKPDETSALLPVDIKGREAPQGIVPAHLANAGQEGGPVTPSGSLEKDQNKRITQLEHELKAVREEKEALQDALKAVNDKLDNLPAMLANALAATNKA